MNDRGIHTRWRQGRMSPFGYEQTSSRPILMSALPPKADIRRTSTDFRF